VADIPITIFSLSYLLTDSILNIYISVVKLDVISDIKYRGITTLINEFLFINPSIINVISNTIVINVLITIIFFLPNLSLNMPNINKLIIIKPLNIENIFYLFK
jgi:hypothetical protein